MATDRNEFEMVAEVRADTGSRAARRLRRRGQIPAVLYGGGKDPMALRIHENFLKRQLDNEAFYSHILAVKINGTQEQAVLKDLQRHPATGSILHLDLQRVRASERLYLNVPLHFVHEDQCPGRRAGGVISHLMIEVEVSCLPKDLPEFIEVDMSALEMGQSIHLSELKLPEGVELTALAAGKEHDQPVVTIQPPRGGAEPGEGEEAEGSVLSASSGE
jgi:large subunit ribosomal protein L25